MPILDLDLSGLSPLDLTQDSQDSQELDLSGIKPINIGGKDVKIPSIPVSSIATPRKKDVNLDLSGIDLDLSNLEPINIASQVPKVSESDLTNDENFSETFKDKATTSTPIQTDFNIAATPNPIKFDEADPSEDSNFAAKAALNSDKTIGIINKIPSIGIYTGIATSIAGERPKFNPTKDDPDVIGKPISFTINTREAIDNGRIISNDDITDAFLSQLSPAAVAANQRYRKETGRNLIEPVNLKFDEVADGSLKVTARPEKSAIDILNAYMRGGIGEARKEAERISNQRLERDAEFSKLNLAISEYEKKHPYLTAVYAGTKSSINQVANLLQNVGSLEEAVAVGSSKGYNSKEYRDLILNEIKQRGFLNQAIKEVPIIERDSSLLPQSKADPYLRFISPLANFALGYGAKTTEEATQFATSLSTYELAGLAGPAGLPTLVYLENINRGNMQAAASALPMALAMGSVSGINKAIAGSGDLLTPSSEGLVLDAGESGTRGLNLQLQREGAEMFKVSSPFVGSEIPVESITPLARQLILRGTQGSIFGGATYLETRNPEEAFHAFVTGLFLPVGGDSRRSSISTIGDIVDSQTGEVIKTIPRLGAADIKFEIPLEKTQVLQFSTEKPLRDIGEGVIANETESGFEARTTPATFRQNLDSAALNYLELKRALENQEWKAPNISLAEAAKRQKALAEAVDVYEKAIPEEYRDWFKKNESVIRAAQRGGNRELLDKVNQIKEGKKRQEQTSPTLDKESIIKKSTNAPKGEKGFSSVDFMQQALENYGDVGIKNKYISQESALRAKNNLGKLPKGLQEGVTLPINWISNQLGNLTTIAAFHIEDFYRRGVEPTLDAFDKRLRGDIGDLADKISQEDLRNIFQRGMDYYNSNNADPFFSGVKQRALEVLPNGETVARIWKKRIQEIILSQEKYADEVKGLGLKDWIQNIPNENRVSKQDIIDFINKNQVKVIEVVKDSNLEAIVDKKYGKVSKRQTSFGLEDYLPDSAQPLGLELIGGKNYKEMLLIDANAKDDYESPHWIEKNVIAHIRFNERTDSKGRRILFIEEIQSDWNQQGRRYGYKGGENPRLKEIEEAVYAINPLAKLRGVSQNDIREVFGARVAEEWLDLSAKESMINRVPQNPFMGNNWKELSIKRILRYAAENGFDGVSLTTAEMQQERYKKVAEGKEIGFGKNSDGTYSINLTIEGDEGLYQTPEMRNISIEKIAELTNKDIANKILNNPNQHGIINLEENIKIGKGYEEYDTTYRNIMKKVGRRFGVRDFDEATIGTKFVDKPAALLIPFTKFNGEDGFAWETPNEKKLSDDFRTREQALQNRPEGYRYYDDAHKLIEGINEQKQEKIPVLEISPSMRTSLTKEGQPLYGTSGLEPLKPNAEFGIRNRITSRDVFNSTKEEVVSSIAKISTTGDERGTVLNSGLNPQEFVEQARLLYKGIKDFGTFTSEMIAQFGDKVKPYLEPIWNYVKDLGSAFNEGFNQFKEDISNASESEAFKNRQSERGFLGLGNAPKVLDYVTSLELRKLNFEKLTNSPKALALEFMRDTGLAQLFPAYGEVFNIFRDVEGMLNSRASNIVKIMDDVRTFTSATEQENVSNILYIGNGEKKTYSPTELAAGDAITGRVPLNSNEINAYAKIREIQDNILSLRMLQKLYREYDRLANLTPGSKAFNDARAKIAKIRNHYQSLADEGYISLQRRGRYAVYGEKLTYSSTQNPAEKFYYLTDSQLDAKNRLDFARSQGFNVNSDLYDTKDSHKFNILSARLTPNILEDLIISSGIDVNKTVIDPNTGNNIKVGDLLENLRNEVYANYKTTSYELNREFVPGFKTDFRTLSQTLGAQLETFSKSFYGDIGKQEAIKSLNKTGIAATDPKLAGAISQFIIDATTSEVPSFIGKAASKARSATYFMSLAFDGMQFVLNGFSQPNTNTYSYFSRLPEMKGADAEVYHVRAMKLSNLILAERLSGRDSIARSSIFSEIAKASGVSKDVVRDEFTTFYNRAKDEHIVTPEFTKSLLEGVGRKNVLESTSRIRDVGRKFRNDWATIFTTAGERVTRTHAFSEAYLIGKEKLGLSGNELYRFMRFAVDATQGHFGKASNPKFVRRGGEVGKLFYQFGSFGNLWFEGLGLAAKKDISNLRQGNFLKTANSSTIRHLLPIVLGAGLSGLPFYNGFRTTWNVMYGEDPQKEYIDKALGDRSLLRNISLYGVTGNKAVSNRFGINVPLVDNLQYALTRDDYSILSGIPAAQLGKRFLYDAPRDYLEGNYERMAEDVLPNVARRLLVGQRYYKKGARSRNNKVLVPRRKISTTEDIIQATTGLQPSEVLEKYDENAFKGVRQVGKGIRSKLKKKANSIYKFLQE
jgi:hypothetical protein